MDQDFNRRESERVISEIPISVRVLRTEDKSEKTPLSLKTREISPGGLKFISPHMLPLGSRLSITIHFPNISEPIKVVGRVVGVDLSTRIHRVEFVDVKSNVLALMTEVLASLALNGGGAERRREERRRSILAQSQEFKTAQILVSSIQKILRKRVVVTGMGAVTPIGIGWQDYWKNLIEGKSGVDKISLFDTTNFPCQIAGEVRGFIPKDHMSLQLASQIDRFAQFGVAASRLAVQDAKLRISRQKSSDMGVIIGTSAAGMTIVEEQLEAFRLYGNKKLSPFAVASIITSNCPSQIAIALGITGPSFSLSTACASGTDSIGTAYQMIRNGELSVAVAGSAEALITPFVTNLFYVAGVLSGRNDDPQGASRPFDKNRDGSVIGEGSGVVVLEELDHALSRGANIYAEVIGYGRTTDAFHAIRQLHSGAQAVKAIQECMRDADIEPNMIDHINAHGSSTVFSDRLETRVMKEALGKHAANISISATKSMIGHLQGGCGGPEVIATVLAIKNNMAHAIRNLDTPDPECDLGYVAKKPKSHLINIALKNSFGFGGKNAALLFKKYA